MYEWISPSLEHHHHARIIVQLDIQRIQLLPRYGKDDAGDAEIAALLASAQLYRLRIEVGGVAPHDFRYRVDESRLVLPHDLDGEVERVLDEAWLRHEPRLRARGEAAP